MTRPGAGTVSLPCHGVAGRIVGSNDQLWDGLEGKIMASRYPNKRRNCLTAAFVRHAAPGKYYDADGLYLRVDDSGAARWAWRGTVHGKRGDLGLGSTRFLSLSGARQKAFEFRKLARAGGDPRALRPARAVPTFAEAAETVVGIHEPGWKDGGKTAAQWRSSLRDYAMKRLGRRRVSEIDTVDVMAVLLPIWTAKAATARKVRQRIGAVMRWSVAQGYRSDNPRATRSARPCRKRTGSSSTIARCRTPRLPAPSRPSGRRARTGPPSPRSSS